MGELEAAESALLLTLDEIDDVNAQIADCEARIADKEREIAETQAALDEAQVVLARRMSTNYKGGGRSLVALLLGSSSFNELVSNIYYARKVSEADAKAISDVKDLKERLEREQAELEEEKAVLEGVRAEKEQLLAQQEEQATQLEAAEAAQAAYVDGLDAEVPAAMAEQRAAELEAERLAAEEAQTRVAIEEETARIAAEAAEAARKAEEAARAAANSSNANTRYYYAPVQEAPADTTTSHHGSLTDAQREIILATAWDRYNAGCIYRTIAGGPEAFGCAGFIEYCYAAAGIKLFRSPERQQALCIMCPESELVPGDLVFWYNHVALYVGDGMIIEATSATGTVRYAPIPRGGAYYGGGYLA